MSLIKTLNLITYQQSHQAPFTITCEGELTGKVQTAKDQRLLVIYWTKVLDFDEYVINPCQYSVANYNFLYFCTFPIAVILDNRQHFESYLSK